MVRDREGPGMEGGVISQKRWVLEAIIIEFAG